jgi:hypothetical protein
MEAKLPSIGEFEVIDHGVHHCQYFQGCGVAYTKYDLCITGCGMASAREAFEDVLEQLCSIGYSVPDALSDYAAELTENDDVSQSYRDCGEDVPEDSELYYYVSVRLKLA